MLVTLLERLAGFILRRPWWVVLLCVIPAVLLALSSRSVPTDLSFTGVMDHEEPQVAQYFKTVRALDLGASLYLLIEGPDDQLDQAVKDIAPALAEHPTVRSVWTEPPLEWFVDRAPWLVEPDVFERWLGLATRPDDLEGAEQLAKDLSKLEQEVRRLRPPGVRVLQITLKRDPLDLSIGGAEFFDLEAVARPLFEQHGVTGDFAGLPAMGAQDQSRTLGRIQLLAPLTLLFVLLVLTTVERSFLRLGAMAFPMVLSAAATLGIIGMLTGAITAVETFFGLLVFGLGDDFALHILFRLRQERVAGHAFGPALTRTMTGSGPGVVTGALTTISAFLMVAIAPDLLARHLGLSGGIGLALCALFMLTLFPATLVLLERYRPLDIRTAPSHPNFRFVSTLSRHAVHHPALHLGIAAVLVAVSLAGLPRFAFETDLQKIFNRDIPAWKVTERLQSLYGVNINPWIVPARSLEELKSLTAEFQADPLFSHVESVARLVRTDTVTRRQALEQAQGEIENQRLVYDALLSMAPDNAAQLKGAVRLLDGLKKALEVGPPTIDTLPEALRQKYVGPDGRLILYVYSREQHLDAKRAILEREHAQKIAPQATSISALLETLMKKDNPWIVPITLATMLMAILVLAFDLRNGRQVLIALMPVLLGGLLSVGFICWIGRPFNAVTTCVVPLIIGLGIDDGIHLVHRIREEVDLAIHEAAARVAMPIAVTTLTTCLSFVALLFTNNPGMESIALVLLVSLPICLLSSVSTIPALCVLLNIRGEAERGVMPRS